MFAPKEILRKKREGSAPRFEINSMEGRARTPSETQLREALARATRAEERADRAEQQRVKDVAAANERADRAWEERVKKVAEADERANATWRQAYEREDRIRRQHAKDLAEANERAHETMVYYSKEMELRDEENDASYRNRSIQRFKAMHLLDEELNVARPSTSTEESSLRDCMLPLTSVVCVAESRLPGFYDALVLISSFLVDVNLSLDLIVSRQRLHLTSWLLANGASPTHRTASVAVHTGNLALVQTVFGKFSDIESLEDLPMGRSEEVAQWLAVTYPTMVAREMARLRRAQRSFQFSKAYWYGRRLAEHWQWEDTINKEFRQRRLERAKRLIKG